MAGDQNEQRKSDPAAPSGNPSGAPAVRLPAHAEVIARPAQDVDDLPELEPAEDLDSLPELEPVEDLDNLPELEPAEDLDSLPELEPAEDGEGSEQPAAALAEASPDGELEAASYRKLYEVHFRGLPRDARIERAHGATGDMLLALCLDPEPGVIGAVLENVEAGLRHARLIADHHGNPVGLDAMGRRAGFLQDAAVRRLLMRNVQTSDALLRRSLGLLPLPLVFRANMGHESSERARRVAREVLRDKFNQASAEQRVALILRTEGRCLPLMPGLTFDQKTTALLCSKSYPSALLVQSLARFGPTPPTLIAVLLKQPLVQRSAHLRKLVLQHKNCPSALKR